MTDSLILPKHLEKEAPRKGVDPRDVDIAKDLLRLLFRGLEKNEWPSYVRGYIGHNADVALILHFLGEARLRGFGRGLKKARDLLTEAAEAEENIVQARGRVEALLGQLGGLKV